MIEEHAAAFGALLDADPHLRPFRGGTVPDLQAPPYVVWWFGVDVEDSDRMTTDTTKTSFRVTTHSIGTRDETAGIVAGRVRAAVLDVVLAVPGWICWPIRHTQGLPPQRDESTGSNTVDVINVWTFQSTPA